MGRYMHGQFSFIGKKKMPKLKKREIEIKIRIE